VSDDTGARRPAGALEAEVLAALWAADRPLTPREVQDQLGGELAYTTVMTALSRLHQKGTVGRERAGRAYAYSAVLDQAGIAATRMRALLDAGHDRAAVLTRFVGSLSDEDERLLGELLQAMHDDEDPPGGRP
jgi:predicted transcriptional regulator